MTKLRWMRLAFPVIALVIALTAACNGSSAVEPYEFAGRTLAPPRQVDDFVLVDHLGESFRLAERPKAISVFFFGYTLCPDVCPTTLADFVRVKRLLGDRASAVDFIFVTVDPERDTPTVLKQRLAVFDTEFIGLTGDRTILEPVYEDFGVAAWREEVNDSAAGYLMAHTSSAFLLKDNLEIPVSFPFGMPAEDMAADIIHVLQNEKSS